MIFRLGEISHLLTTEKLPGAYNGFSNTMTLDITKQMWRQNDEKLSLVIFIHWRKLSSKYSYHSWHSLIICLMNEYLLHFDDNQRDPF